VLQALNGRKKNYFFLPFSFAGERVEGVAAIR
jgi:hypothetical protein